MIPAMSDAAAADPREASERAWRSILELVGWGSNRPPRFPTVAMELGLAPKQLGVIWRLEPGSQVPMRVLSESLFCEPSYMTDLVDRLEERGLLERRSSTVDRRVKLIALTEEGLRTRERALEILYAPPEEFAALDQDELETVATLLAKAVNAAEDTVASS